MTVQECGVHTAWVPTARRPYRRRAIAIRCKAGLLLIVLCPIAPSIVLTNESNRTNVPKVAWE